MCVCVCVSHTCSKFEQYLSPPQLADSYLLWVWPLSLSPSESSANSSGSRKGCGHHLGRAHQVVGPETVPVQGHTWNGTETKYFSDWFHSESER